MSKIYIIRHGESLLNSNNKTKENIKIFSGQFESSLSDKGKKQSRKLNSYFTNKSIETIYVSSSNRTLETLKYSEIESNNKVISDLIKERSLGEFEGISYDEVFKNEKYFLYWPEEKKSDFRHHFQNKAPGGENYTDVINRTSKFLVNMDSKGDNVVISHLISIRCILYNMGILNSKNIFDFYIDNGEILEVEFSEKKKVYRCFGIDRFIKYRK